MDLNTLMFWIFAVILVGAALCVVGFRNIVHSALALVLVFAMASGIYVLLNADFIAIVQILIYVGAVMILILFALMLTRITGQSRTNPVNKLWFPAVIICALICASIIYAVVNSSHVVNTTATAAQIASQSTGVNNVVRIGQLLYSPTSYSYVLPFEIASLVLLVAIVGAIVIGREDK
jgi:NADH:ubiquinone oxidoreductase subunit 6 (subunit J)